MYTIGWAVYSLYFHPLSKYPGPKLYAISRLPREYANLSGTLHYKVKALHGEYGNVLRLGPNELSFVSAQALKDVYNRHGREGCFPKDHIAYNLPPNGVHSILTVVDDNDHSRYRRLLNHAFSEKALQEQAPLLQKYVDLLMTLLHANASEGPQDMVAWFNYIAFDIIGDLSLGEPFGCLEESNYHHWVSFSFSSFKGATFLSASKRFPPLSKVLLRLVPKKLKDERARHGKSTAEKVLRRMEMGSERGDFMSNV